VAASVSRPGQPLEPGVRTEFTSRLGRDFSDVRIHADADAATSAARLGASAYTVGRSIVFGQDQYAPGTAAGRNLIAHELAHVVQQHSAVGEAAGVAPPTGDLERDAERAAATKRPPSLQTHARCVQMQQAPAGVLGKEMAVEDQRAIDRYLSEHKFKVFLGGAIEMDGAPIEVPALVEMLQQQVVPGRDPRAVENYINRKVAHGKVWGPPPPARPHDKTLGQQIEDVFTKPRTTPTGPPTDVPSPAPQQGDYGKVMRGGNAPGGPSITSPAAPIPEGKHPAAVPSSSLTGVGTAPYRPGGLITFTVTCSKDFWSSPGLPKQVVLLDEKRNTVATQELEPAKPTIVRWQAPSKGRYRIQVRAGDVASEPRGTSELTVEEFVGPRQ